MSQTALESWPPRLPPGFPLTVVKRGYMKRIAGRVRWICGKVTPDEALRIYHQKAAVLVGADVSMPLPKPIVRAAPAGIVTMHYILARWLADKRSDAERRELTPGSYVGYKSSAKRMDAIVGHVAAADFTPEHTRQIYDQLHKRHGADWAKRALGHLRSACNHAVDYGWVDNVNLGDRVLAKLRARPKVKMKWRLYTPGEIRLILNDLERKIKAADGRARPSLVQLRAMIYLALNGGYGAQELSDLPRSVIDLAGARIDYSRGKTGADHVVPLWPETVKAIKPVLAMRAGDELLFRTREGNPWCHAVPKFKGGRLVGRIHNDNVNQRFTDLVKPLGLKFDRSGFYKLKHLHSTTADAAGDPHATFTLAGHSLPGARGHYVKVGEDRLRKVVEHIRRELLHAAPPAKSSTR